MIVAAASALASSSLPRSHPGSFPPPLSYPSLLLLLPLFRRRPCRSTQKEGLHSILFTCAYLATKVVDRMPHADMLRRMLTVLYGTEVSRDDAQAVSGGVIR